MAEDEGALAREMATVEDYLAAMGALRPTLSADMVRDFTEDIAEFSRT